MSVLLWNRATRKLNAASISIRPAIVTTRRHLESLWADVAKLRWRSSVELKQISAHVVQLQKGVVALGAAVAEKRRRVRESARARENELQGLLASSLDAIVITDREHRVVAANPKALELLGVSNTNVKEFAIDAFLSESQVTVFDGKGWPFIRSTERRGKCKIRRLDGSTRSAEFIFVANFLPLRNLCRFHSHPGRPPL